MTQAEFDIIRKAAIQADDQFSQVIKDCGYKSRWDWSQVTDSRPLWAYQQKVKADEALHFAFYHARPTA